MKTPTAIWTWSVDARIYPARLCAALEAVLVRPVVPLGAADPTRLPADAVICDVWHTSGDFPTIVECYGPPAGMVEAAVVAVLARRLGHRFLVADDTLNPGRHLLATPDGTLRPAHVDVADTDEGAAHSNARPCTIATQRCRESEECRRSRWEPDSAHWLGSALAPLLGR
jgi:hypothetical protein